MKKNIKEKGKIALLIESRTKSQKTKHYIVEIKICNI